MSKRIETTNRVDEILRGKRLGRIGEGTNQARLGSGCVCAHGCDSCARLAEAFEEVTETLRLLTEVCAAKADIEHCMFEQANLMGPLAWADMRNKGRAALRLADRVARR